jgi:DMSO/TMAO reductase YedYZ molybdopterin-dependent catalytic subunit
MRTAGSTRRRDLSALLEAVHLKLHARYAVFYCADPREENGRSLYYESIDLEDAFHPQTILAYELNDQPLPIRNGAPLFLRLQRQVGYKMAKYVMRLEIVEGLSRIAGEKVATGKTTDMIWYAGIQEVLTTSIP